MKTRRISEGLMRDICLRPGMHLHVANFKLREAAERRFESATPLLRFYYYVAASGYWELRSPYRSASETTINHCDHFSTVLFYPELEGKMCLPADRRQFHLSISVAQSVLREYLGDSLDQFPENLQAISEGCDNRGFYHSGSLSSEMNMAIQQLLNSPHTGAMQRLYMESKAIELIAHKLAQIVPSNGATQARTKLRPDEIDRIHYAGKILCRDLECPPKLLDLAHTVGTNHSTLNKGFRQVFGATVFGYLRQLRLTEAKRLLMEEGMNVTEAALTVGYSSIPSFSRAFLEFFGENPMRCLKKK